MLTVYKKALSLLCAAMLILTGICAFAEGFAAEEVSSPCEVDLDGDGTAETLAMTDILLEDGAACMGIEVKSAAGRAQAKTEIIGCGRLILSDIDNNGLPEILFTGDMCSDDYISYCWRFTNGELVPVPFEDGNVLLAGLFVTESGHLEAFATVNALGTYTGFRDLVYEDGRLMWADAYWRLINEASSYTPVLILKQDIYVLSGMGDESDYGEETVLTAGTMLYLTETDGETYVSFSTEGGVNGMILLEDDGYGTPCYVNGMPEEEVFEGIEYAD